jgi:hypothetical protein
MQANLSWPGIAVRRTASLPLAYAGHPCLRLRLKKDVDARDKRGHDGTVCAYLLRPSIGVIVNLASSIPSMQLTLSATTSVPSGFLPSANTSTPQSLQD